MLLPLLFFPKFFFQILSGIRCNLSRKVFEDLSLYSIGAQWYSQTFCTGEWTIQTLTDSPDILPEIH